MVENGCYWKIKKLRLFLKCTLERFEWNLGNYLVNSCPYALDMRLKRVNDLLLVRQLVTRETQLFVFGVTLLRLAFVGEMSSRRLA